MPVLVESTIPAHVIRTALDWAAAGAIDLEPVLTAAGLTRAQVETPGALCTAGQMTAFVRGVWRLTDDELFGVGSRPVPRGSWALLAHGLIHARTLGEVVARFQGFQAALPGLPPLAITAGEDLVVALDQESSYRDPYHLVAELTLLIAHRFAAWLTGSRLTPTALLLDYQPGGTAAEYQQIFGTAPRRGPTALVFDRDVLTRPVVRGAADLAAYLSAAPGPIFAQRDHDASVTDQVRVLLSPIGVGVWPRADEVASRMGYSEPHLRRLLRAEGHSLSGLRDELRRDLAVGALVEGRTVAEVTVLVGFTEASAFRRAFRRWVGSAPAAYRANGQEQ